MIKRIKEPYIGKWALVGGKWDFGESLSEAICGEVYEETGLRTGFTSLRGVINERMHPKSQTDGGGHFLLFVCELAVCAGEATEHAEGKVAWFSVNMLVIPQIKQPPANVLAVLAFSHDEPLVRHISYPTIFT